MMQIGGGLGGHPPPICIIVHPFSPYIYRIRRRFQVANTGEFELPNQKRGGIRIASANQREEGIKKGL